MSSEYVDVAYDCTRDDARPEVFMMGSELAISLTFSQIEAAIRLQQRLADEAPSERALDILSECLPAWDLESCLVKSAALNQLYFTNVKPFMRAVRHVHHVMSEPTENLKEHEFSREIGTSAEDRGRPEGVETIQFCFKARPLLHQFGTFPSV